MAELKPVKNSKVDNALQIRNKRKNRTNVELNTNSRTKTSTAKKEVYGPQPSRETYVNAFGTNLDKLYKMSETINDGNWHSAEQIAEYNKLIDVARSYGQSAYDYIIENNKVDFGTYKKTGKKYDEQTQKVLDLLSGEITKVDNEKNVYKENSEYFKNYESADEFDAYTNYYKKSYSEIKNRITEIDNTKVVTEEEKKKRAQEKKYLNNIIASRQYSDSQFASDVIADNKSRIAEIENELEPFDNYQNAIKEIEKIPIMNPMSTSVRKVAGANYYVTDNGTAFYRSANDKQKDLDALRNELKNKMNESGKTQDEIDALEKEKITLESTNKSLKTNSEAVDKETKAKNSKDFKEKSGYVSTKAEGFFDKLSSDGLGYNDSTYEYINNVNGYRDKYLRYHRTAGTGDSVFEKNGYDYINEEEVSVYNYYYATKGAEAAEKYLDSITQRLRSRKASKDYKEVKGDKVREFAYGLFAGFDSFSEGLKNVFNFTDEYIPPTATQMTSDLIKEELGKEGAKLPDWLGGTSVSETVYDFFYTAGNMVPSILTSTAVGIVNPTAGAALGAGLMGTSAAGNAYAQALNSGMEKGQARVYSTLVGLSEAGLQSILGGIGNLGGKASVSSFLKNTVGKVENGLLSFALNFGGSVIAEGVEEGLQEILNPMFENIAYGANINGWEDIEWGEVAYSALLGGMMGGVFEGPGAVIDSYKKASSKHKAVKILKLGVEGSVISTAESLDIDTSSYAKEMSKLQEYADMLEMGKIKNSKYKKQFNKVASEIVKLNNEITEAGGKVELPADTKKSGIAKLFDKGFFKKTNADTQEEQTGADTQTQNLSSEKMARKGVSAQDGFVSQENVAQGVDVGTNVDADVNAENVAVDGTVVPETESAVSSGARTNMSAFEKVLGSDTVTNEDLSYHRDDVHYKTEYFQLKKELASTKSKVSSAEFSKEFNRIYELGLNEDVSANSIESDIFTPAQVRRIYASGMVDDSVSHGYSDAIDFESAVKQLEEKAVVKQFTERLASKILDADVDTIKRVAKKLGVKVKFVDNLPNNNPSRYVESEKTIYIDKNTDKPMQQLFLHELTHFFETADGYLEFQDTVLESKAFEDWLHTPTELKDKKTYKDVDDFLHEIMERYDFETSDEAKTEMVAFFVSENLFQKDFGGIGRLCNELTGTKRERFVAFIKNIFKRFKNAMSEMGKLERKFLKLYDTVGKNKNTTSKSDVKNMLVKTTDNKAVVVIDEDILAGKPKNAWIKTVKSVLLSKFSKGIPISGRLIKVNKISREEFTNSKYSKYLRDTDGNVYVDKLKSANNLDEIVLASTNYINEDLKHARKDNFKEFARGDVLIRVGKNDYSAKVIVGFTGNNMVLYDVVDFTPSKFEIKKKSPHAVKHSKTTRNGETSTNIISDSSENVKENAKVKNPDMKNLLLGNEDALMDDGSYFDIDENDEVISLSAERYQRELKKNPKLAVFDKRQIELKAKAIAKMYGSKASQKHVAEELLWIYNNIKNVDESGNTAKPRATALANEIFEYMVEESENGDIFDELRAFFKHNPTVYDESLIDEFSSDWGEFIRKNGKRLSLKKAGQDSQGMGVDELYDSLHREFPGYFPENHEGPVSQLKKIAEVYENQKSGMYQTFNQDNKAQIVKDILGEIYRGYFDIDYIHKNSKVAKEQKKYKFDDEQFDEGGYIDKKSFKRAQREEINRRSKQYVDEQTELFRKGTIGATELARRLTAHYARVSLSAKIKPVESYEIALRKYKERYDQVNTNTRKLLKELRNKLKNPTENNYIPEEIVDLVEAALEIGNKENFDLSHRLEQIKDAIKKRDVAPEVVDAYKDAVEQIEKKLREKSLGKAFAEICQRYDKYKFGETKDSKMGEFEQTFYCYHEAVAEKLHEVAEILEDADMVKLTLKQATALEEGLHCLTHFVNDSVYAIGMNEKAKVYEVASGSREEISNSGGFDKAIEKGFLPLLNPERFFKALGGFKHNSWCEKIGQMLNDGQTKALQIKQKLQEVLAPILENENFAKAQKAQRYDKDSLVDIGLTTAKGESVSVPKGFAISLFKHLQNEANLNHALKGGFKIPKFRTYYKRGGNVAFDKGKGKRVYISDVGSTLIKLENCFDDYDGQVIKSVTELFDTHTKNFYNQTTLDVFGFKKARVEKGYFPMITDSNFTQSDFASAFDATLKNQGNMKQRVQGAANPILLFDIFDVVNREIDRCGEYCGKLKAEITFHRIYNTVMPNYETSYKDEISEAGKKYIKNFMQDYSGTRDTESSHVLNKLRSNVATSALLLNANVVFKQLSSYPSAAGIVGFKPLLKAFATDGNGRVLFYKANTKLIDKYSAYHHIRREGFSTQETVDLRNNSFYDKRGLRFLFGWITAVDSAVTGRLWYAAEFYVKQNNPELEVGTDEFNKEVAKVYDRIILETQDNYTTMQRPDILRNPNAIIKSTVMFMTQPLQQLGSLYEASGNLAAQEKAFKAGEVDESVLKEARTKMVRTATGVLTSIAFCSLMAFCGAVAKGDLDDYLDEYGEFNAEGFFGGIGKDMVNNAMGMIPFGNTLFETLNSIVTQEFRFGLSVANIDLINDTIDAFANLGQLFFNGDLTADEFKNKAVKLFEKTCSLLGIPTRNAKNLVGGFTNLFRTGDWFALSEKKSRKQYFAQMYDCVIKGDDKRYKELYNELLEKGYTVNEIEGGIKSVLKDAEAEDITEAAQALNDGDVNLYNEIIAEFVERGFDEKIVTETIESVANSLKPDELTEEEQKTKEKAKYDYMSDIIKNINFDGFTNAQKATAEQYAENVADEYGYQKATGKVKNEKFVNAIRHDKAGTIPIEDYVLGMTVTDKKFADADGDGTVSPEEKVKAIDNSNLSTDIKTYLKAINIMGSTKVDTNADGRADTAFNKLSAEEQKEYIDENKKDINSKLEDIQHSEEKSKAKEEYREQVSKKVDVMGYPEEMRSSVQSVIDSVAGAMAGEKVDGDWEAKTVNNFVDYDKSGFIDINTYVKYKVYTKGKTTQAEQFKAINELVGVSSEQKLYMKLWVAVKSKRFDDDGDGKKEKYFTKYSSSWQENYIRNNKNSIIANCDNWQ